MKPWKTKVLWGFVKAVTSSHSWQETSWQLPLPPWRSALKWNRMNGSVIKAAGLTLPLLGTIRVGISWGEERRGGPQLPAGLPCFRNTHGHQAVSSWSLPVSLWCLRSLLKRNWKCNFSSADETVGHCLGAWDISPHARMSELKFHLWCNVCWQITGFMKEIQYFTALNVSRSFGLWLSVITRME